MGQGLHSVPLCSKMRRFASALLTCSYAVTKTCNHESLGQAFMQHCGSGVAKPKFGKLRCGVQRDVVLGPKFSGTVFEIISNPLLGEPVVCTPDSRGFRHFRGFRDFD